MPPSDRLIARVAALFQAGPVVPFGPPKGPKVPTLLVGGRKYVLSTDGGPLGDLDDPESEGMLGGGQLIQGPSGNKWKFLWSYNTERQRLHMWRVSDGNEKFEDSARNLTSKIVKLERKGQLNRVTNEEFRKLEAHMNRAQDDTLKQLQDSWEDSKSDYQREVQEALERLLDSFKPKLEAQIEAVESGAIPMGWRDTGHGHELRSKLSLVISRFFETDFSIKKCDDYLRGQGIDPDAPGRDIQAVEWARGDILDATYNRYLPST